MDCHRLLHKWLANTYPWPHAMRRAEESLWGRKVSSLTQAHVQQMVVTVDGPSQLTPWAIRLDTGIVDVPALANDAAGEAHRPPGERASLPTPAPSPG